MFVVQLLSVQLSLVALAIPQTVQLLFIGIFLVWMGLDSVRLDNVQVRRIRRWLWLLIWTNLNKYEVFIIIGSVCKTKGWQECLCSGNTAELCHVCCVVNGTCISTFTLSVSISVCLFESWSIYLFVHFVCPFHREMDGYRCLVSFEIVVDLAIIFVDTAVMLVHLSKIFLQKIHSSIPFYLFINSSISLLFTHFRCIGVDNDQILNDLLDIFTLETLNSFIEWLKRYWWVPIVVIIGIIILIVLLHLTYRKRKPIKKAARRAR